MNIISHRESKFQFIFERALRIRSDFKNIFVRSRCYSVFTRQCFFLRQLLFHLYECVDLSDWQVVLHYLLNLCLRRITKISLIERNLWRKSYETSRTMISCIFLNTNSSLTSAIWGIGPDSSLCSYRET